MLPRRNAFYDEELSTSCKISKRDYPTERWAEDYDETAKVKPKKRVTFNLDYESRYTSRNHHNSGFPQYDSSYSLQYS